MTCVLSEVRCYTPEGKLKQTVTQEQLVVRNLDMMMGFMDCERIKLDVGHGSKADGATMKCVECGKATIQKRAGRKYCSMKCNTKAASKRLGFNRTPFQKDVAEDKRCLHCKKAYEHTRADQMYCSKSCHSKSAYAKKPKTVYTPVKCPQCTFDFTPKRHAQIYCNEKCRKVVENRRAKIAKKGE